VLFAYCTQILHLSEHAAYLRIEAARGGTATIDGIELRCRAHNQYEAELDFGPRGVPILREDLGPDRVLGVSGPG
jgi:hypothetical protein